MKRLQILIGIFCISSLTVFSQKYNFKNFSVGDGLTQSEIYAICEDSLGHLWFGSRGGGIIQYDGYTFTSYREEDGLLSNFVNAICVDDKGNLWIGTDEGVCMYDGRNFSTPDDSGSVKGTTVMTVLQDKQRNLWAGTESNGLYKFNGNTYEPVTIKSDQYDIDIHCLYESKDSTLWIGTNRGVCKYKDSTLTWYTRRDGLAGNIVRSICDDGAGNIWFGTFGNGVSRFDHQSFTNYSVYNGLCNNTVYASYADTYGNIWFGTAHGVSRFDGSSFKTYREQSGLASNVVVCIYQDATENMWFGTSGGGVSRYDNERFIHYTSNEKMGRGVYSVIQAPNENMVFGTSIGGITVFDGENYTLLKGINRFTNSRVISLYYTPDSTLWCGTHDDGAYRFKERGFEHFSKKDGLHSNNIAAFTTDTAGNIWFASLDSGICVYYQDQNKFQKYDKTHGLESNVAYTLMADKIGNVWVGTANGGIHKITLAAHDSLPPKLTHLNKNKEVTDKSVKSITIDTSNNPHFGTAGEGIIIYNGEKFISVKKDDGLCSNNIYLLLFDDQYNLWVGTELGIDRLTFDSAMSVAQCAHYGRNEGFSGIEAYRNSCSMDNKGNLWFGTVNGATRYNPKEDKIITCPPILHITGIRLFYKNIANTKFVDSLLSWYPVPYNLRLPHRQNNLTFEFAGIYHRNPEAVRYKWMLEGADDDWSPTLSQREVTYSNLAPGNYTFKVVSCNEYGIWNTKPALFTFEILTPLWQRWWFISLFVLLIIFTVWRIIHLRFKRMKMKNKIEQEKLEMEKTIIELEQEAARLQMNPHFIFNSLNSIQGFIATNDAFQAKRYLAKFARLMRLILENAREEFIPLENEVEILENYLELEKLSTNNKFDFAIKVNKSINAEVTEIPPMMLQPFVENAIIHGIKKKEGKGTIKIHFSTIDELVHCEITDDGVGRKESSEKKDKGTSKHKSTGITVTQRRLEQLKLQTGLNARIEIEDLKDKKGHPAGTKVNIFIPFESY